jgi:hypothetical protein
MTSAPHTQSVAPAARLPVNLATFGAIHHDVVDRGRSLDFWRDAERREGTL